MSLLDPSLTKKSRFYLSESLTGSPRFKAHQCEKPLPNSLDFFKQPSPAPSQRLQLRLLFSRNTLQYHGLRRASERQVYEISSHLLCHCISPNLTSFDLDLGDESLKPVNGGVKLCQPIRMDVATQQSWERFVDNIAAANNLLDQNILAVKSCGASTQPVDKIVVILPDKLIELGPNRTKCFVSSKQGGAASRDSRERSRYCARKSEPLFRRSRPIGTPNWSGYSQPSHNSPDQKYSDCACHSGVSIKVHILKVPWPLRFVERIAA